MFRLIKNKSHQTNFYLLMHTSVSFLIFVLLGGCSNLIQKEVKQQSSVQIANPAAVHCVNSGGEYQILKNEGGSEFGICHFTNYKCEAWAFFKGQCP